MPVGGTEPTLTAESPGSGALTEHEHIRVLGVIEYKEHVLWNQ